MSSFEASRIYSLTKSRALQQKRLFTNWINAQLEQFNDEEFLEPLLNGKPTACHLKGDSLEARLTCIFSKEPVLHRITDLYSDLSDGRVLHRLLEIFTGRKMNLARGSMRAHNLENVNRALEFLKDMQIHLENIGPIDIVDGNAHLILGLIWTFILHFQLRQLSMETKLLQCPLPSAHTNSTLDIKDALLRWCQLKTANYPQIDITNFTSSWRDGRALGALLYHHRPDLTCLEALIASPSPTATGVVVSPLERLSKVFLLAAENFRTPPLIPADDFIACCSDERCVVAVVATWYQCINRDRVVKKSSSRLAVVLRRAVSRERSWMAFAKEAYRLQRWVKENVRLMQEMSSKHVDTEKEPEELLQKLLRWQTEEKNTKLSELGNIELDWITLKIRALGSGYQNPTLSKGFGLQDVQNSWRQLEKAEQQCDQRVRWNMEHFRKRAQDKCRFQEKVERHSRWLTACDQLEEMAPKLDFACLQQTSTIDIQELHHQRSTTLHHLRRHTIIVSDAEAHHNHKISLIQHLEPNSRRLNILAKRWISIKEKFQSQSKALSFIYTTFNQLIEINGLTNNLNTIWTKLKGGCFHEEMLPMWENALMDLTSRGEALFSSLEVPGAPGLQNVVGRTCARFWGVNWTLTACLQIYKKFFRKRALLLSFDAAMKEKLEAVREYRDFLHFLHNRFKKSGDAACEDDKTIRLIEIKLRLLQKEAPRMSADFALSASLSERPLPLLHHPDGNRPLLDGSTVRHRRTSSLETPPTVFIRDTSHRTTRQNKLSVMHQQFEFDDIARVAYIRALKGNLEDELGGLREQTRQTRKTWFEEVELHHEELRYTEDFVAVLSMTSLIRSESVEIRHWLKQTTSYFEKVPLPCVLSEIIEESDHSQEHWWEESIQKRALSDKLQALHCRMRRKEHIKLQCKQFQCCLWEMRRQFLSCPGIQRYRSEPHLQEAPKRVLHKCFRSSSSLTPFFQRNRKPTGSSIFSEICSCMTRTLRREITKLLEEIDHTWRAANDRQELIINDLENLNAIQTCFDLLAWIKMSREILIDSPFIRLRSASSTTLGENDDVGDDDEKEEHEEDGIRWSRGEHRLVVLEKELARRTESSLSSVQGLEESVSQSCQATTWYKLLEFTFDEWNELVLGVKMKRLSVDTAKHFFKLKKEATTSCEWIKIKKELLLASVETTSDIGEMIRMECRMAGWEGDLTALRERVSYVKIEGEKLTIALKDLSSPLNQDKVDQKYWERAIDQLDKWMLDLLRDWTEFETLLEEYQKRLEASLEFQALFQELEAVNLLLLGKQNLITATEQPTTISDIEEQQNVFGSIAEELKQSRVNFNVLLHRGTKLLANQEEAVASAVKEKITNLESAWRELETLCNHHIGSLKHQWEIQIFLRDTESLNVVLSRKENNMVQTNYLPTIEHIRGKLRTQIQVDASIKALGEQLASLIETAEKYHFSDKYTSKLDAVSSRYHTLLESSSKILHLLEFRLCEKENLHQLESVEEWILERQAAVTANFCEADCVGVKEKKAIQKYHTFRNFEAEVKSYENLANKTFQDVQATITDNATLAGELLCALDRSMHLWNELKTVLITQGSKLMEAYRAIIISEGCEELLNWLQKASMKIFGIQNCNYLKQDSARLEQTAQDKRCPQSAENLCLSFASTEVPSRLKAFSISETSLPLLVKSAELGHIDNFDLSGLNSAMQRTDDLKAELSSKRAFLKELEEHFEFLVETNENFTDYEGRLHQVRLRFAAVEKRLSRCQGCVSAHQRVISALRTMAEEIQWLDDKRQHHINVESSTASLLEAEKLLIRHHHLTNEVDNRIQRNSTIIKTVVAWLRVASSESNISQKEEKEVEETAARAASDDTYCAAFVARRRGLARELFAVSSGLIFRQAVVHRDLGVRHFILEHWRSWFLQQMDLLEFYNWLIETEASVMAESHAASGLASATAAIKKHAVVDGMVSDFQAPRFRTLSSRTSDLLSVNSRLIATEQSRLSRCLQVAPLLVESKAALEAKVYRHKLRRRIHGFERAAAKLKSAQMSVQTQFSNLRDLVMEKKHRLHELLALNRLYEEVSDLEDWIKAGIQEALTCNTGRDLEECARFQRDFVNLRQSILGDADSNHCNGDGWDDHSGVQLDAFFQEHGWGSKAMELPELLARLDQLGQLPTLPDSRRRLSRGVAMARQMIALKHSDSPRIAQWLDSLTGDWCELRELLATRGALLRAAGNRLLFLQRCEEVTGDINERLDTLPVVLGADAEAITRQQRQLVDFQQITAAIEKRLNWVLCAANVLQPLYADVQASEMQRHKARMLEVWRQLNETIESRSRILRDADMLCRWLGDLQTTLTWLSTTHERIAAARNNIAYEDSRMAKGDSLFPEQDLSDLMAKHTELWDEISTWEKCIKSRCAEGMAMASEAILEGDDFSVAPAYIGIHKMLQRCAQKLQLKHAGCAGDPSVHEIREAACQQLRKANKPLPSEVIKVAVSVLLVDLCQVKVCWKRHRTHLAQLAAKTQLLRDIINLEEWVCGMEKNFNSDDLGSNLEETLLLNEQHNKFARVVALQEEKFNHLAQFQITCVDDEDDWETPTKQELMDMLERLNVLPKSESPLEDSTFEDAVFADDSRNVEKDAIERFEGVVYRCVEDHRRLSNRLLLMRGPPSVRWQKCFAVLAPSPPEFHLLDIPRSPQKQRWISERHESDFIVQLNSNMDASVGDEVGGVGDVGLTTFQIINKTTGERLLFKAQTADQAQTCVSIIKMACMKCSHEDIGETTSKQATAVMVGDVCQESKREKQTTNPWCRFFRCILARRRQRSRSRQLEQQQRFRQAPNYSEEGDYSREDEEEETAANVEAPPPAYLVPPSFSMVAMAHEATTSSSLKPSRVMATFAFSIKSLNRRRQRLQHIVTSFPIGETVFDVSSPDISILNDPCGNGDTDADEGVSADADSNEISGRGEDEAFDDASSTDIDAVDEFS